MRTIIAGFKLFLFALNCLWVMPAQSLVLLITKKRGAYILPRVWYQLVCRIFRVKIMIKGVPERTRQTLYMSNHLSYLDISALGSLLNCSFVSKSDVASWPLFGFLSRLQQTAFVVRKRTEAGTQKNELAGRIAKGDSLIIFPEGTSTGGQTVIPFKSSLFSLAYGEGAENIYIQPITIAILKADNQPATTQDIRDIYAWYGDMELGPHIWNFAKGRGATLCVTFHPPLPASALGDRKSLAKATYETVCKAL